MANQRIILTVGVSASGKDYFYKQYCIENPTTIRITKDDIRKEIRSEKGLDEFARVNEKEVLRREETKILEALNKGFNVALTNTHLNPMHINERIPNLLRSNGLTGKVDIVVDKQFLSIPINVCIERDSKRTGVDRVGEAVIRNQWKQAEAWKES